MSEWFSRHRRHLHARRWSKAFGGRRSDCCCAALRTTLLCLRMASLIWIYSTCFNSLRLGKKNWIPSEWDAEICWGELTIWLYRLIFAEVELSDDMWYSAMIWCISLEPLSSFWTFCTLLRRRLSWQCLHLRLESLMAFHIPLRHSLQALARWLSFHVD